MNQLNECDKLYERQDFRGLLKKCDEILENNPENQSAIGYKTISQIFLGNPDEALETLERGVEKYPKNYYLKNNLSMAYYDLGEYEKSLKCCDEGLKIKNFDWLWENKIKALLKLDLIDEAIECYENAPGIIEIVDLMIDVGKYRETLRYCIEEDLDGFESIVDKIKQKNTCEIGEYYISWIYKIKSKSDIRTCPECGGKLIPIVWGYPLPEMLEQSERDEIFLAGCCLPPNPPGYHCKDCGSEFDLGCMGLHIECEDYRLTDYIEYKIKELTSKLKIGSHIAIKSLETLKNELGGFDDREFGEFIGHLTDLDYLYEPCEGFIRLVGFDDWKCMKEYCDEGKYAAPRWLVYPQLSLATIGWRMGAGENYVMNMPYYGEEFDKLFPRPRYWEINLFESPYRPFAPIGFFWNEDGKPKYPHADEGIKVNEFITLTDEKDFTSDTFTFKSIEHALLLSKALYFEKSNKNDLKDIEYTSDEEKTWRIYEYSVLLNASYFKIMQDEELRKKLLETGDEPLIYDSDDNENLFGRALMELRDEIRRLCKNEDLIDWEYTEYLKYKPWLD